MSYNSLKNKTFFKKYKLIKILGTGSFGCVFQGKNINDQSDIAIKVERKDSKSHLLEVESNFLNILKGYGIPEIKSYGYSGKYYVLVEELLGPNLIQLKNIKRFTLKDISMIGIQLMDRMEYIHSKNIIHRDIKPENFTIGYHNITTIYAIDFGISRKYRSSRTGKHVNYSLTGKMFGTVRYVSYNGSRGVEQSRRDDLESIGYMIIFLINGNLPWQGLKLKGPNLRRAYNRMLKLKQKITPEELCKGLPIEFSEYIKYCKGLSFEQDPDYEYLRNRFRNILMNLNEINDLKFTWTLNKNNISRKNIIDNNINKEKYINKYKRKETPQKRLYRAIRHSLEREEKSVKKIKTKSDLSDIIINEDIYNNSDIRGKSEECKKITNCSNKYKDIVSYNSLLAHYNMNILGFQDDFRNLEICEIIRKSNKISILSPDKINNSNIINDNNNKIQNDYKSTDFSTKNISKESFNELSNQKNEKINNKLLKKNYNLSVDLDKNFFKEINISEKRKSTHSQNEIIKKKLKIKTKNYPNEKRKLNCKNIYTNAINKIKDNLDKIYIIKQKQKDNFTYDINKNQNKNDIKISQNLINKLNTNEDTFSFRNCEINNNIKKGKVNINTNKNTKVNINKKIQNKNYINNNKVKNANVNNINNINNNNKINNCNINNININNNKLYKKSHINNAIERNIINNNGRNNGYISNNGICDKVEMNKALRTSKINNNINLNLNNFVENNNINKQREINIIINNNVKNYNRNSLRRIPDNITRQSTKPSITSSDNSKMLNKIKIQKINNTYNTNDKIIENDYNSYHYINKNLKNNYINRNIELIQNNNLNTDGIKYYNPINKNNKIYECNFMNSRNTKKINNSNDATNRVKKLQKKRQIHFSEYNSLYSNKEQPNISKNNIYNNLIRLNTYNNPSSSNQDENPFLVGKMKVIKLNKKKNYQQIKTPPKSIYNNSSIINNNNEKILIKDNNYNNINQNSNANINNNFTHKNNFLNDFTSVNLKKQYIINENGKIDIRIKKNNIYRNHYFSPDIIKTKNKLDFRLNIGSPEPKRLETTYRSISNKFKKKNGFNYNSNYIEDLENYRHIPRNINNLNSNINDFFWGKCFNRVDV